MNHWLFLLLLPLIALIAWYQRRNPPPPMG